MMLALALFCIAALLMVSILALPIAGSRIGHWFVYGGCLHCSLILLFLAVEHLLAESVPLSITLPLGLPWVGANFRIDALGAFFLSVVNLGAASASLFALGYGRYEQAPHRVLPFYPAFLAGMNMVVLASDAFSFLVCWEFMSLSSWALVMAHHRVSENARAGYIYLVMATFGTLVLVLTFGLLAGPGGGYTFADMRNIPQIGRASW